MAGDGGYPEVWRHYIRSANFNNSGHYVTNLRSDVDNMRHQIELDGATLALVTETSTFVQTYLSGFTAAGGEVDPIVKNTAVFRRLAVVQLAADFRAIAGRLAERVRRRVDDVRHAVQLRAETCPAANAAAELCTATCRNNPDRSCRTPVLDFGTYSCPMVIKVFGSNPEQDLSVDRRLFGMQNPITCWQGDQNGEQVG